MFTLLSFDTDPITPMVNITFSYDFHGVMKTHSALMKNAESAEHRIISEKRYYLLGKTERFLRNCEKVNSLIKANRWTTGKSEKITILFNQLRDYHDYNYTLPEICRSIKDRQNAFYKALPAETASQYVALDNYLSDMLSFINKEIKFIGQSQKSQVISSGNKS